MIPDRMKVRIARAMTDPDRWVIQMRYLDTGGELTERCVSPIRFIGHEAMLALCLCREEPRRFDLNKCGNVRLLPAEDVLMPVEIRHIGRAG